jgi:tetratricopeptide (TPR) repeat protein
MESGASEECMDLMKIATDICENKESIEYAHLCNTAGCAEYERGHVKEAYPYMIVSRRIREKLLPWNHPELADTYNNYANLVLQEFKPGALDKALVLYQRALEIDETQPEEEKSKVLHLKHQNLGLVFNLKGDYKKATYHIQLAAKYAKSTFGDVAHHVAV